MAVVLFMRVPKLSLERYDLMMAELGLDANPPAGEILHIASEAVGSVNVCEVWQTAEAAESFVERRLRDAVGVARRAGAALVSRRAAPQSVCSGPRDDQPDRRQLRGCPGPPLARVVVPR